MGKEEEVTQALANLLYGAYSEPELLSIMAEQQEMIGHFERLGDEKALAVVKMALTLQQIAFDFKTGQEGKQF